MVIKVIVGEDENIDTAIHRLRDKQQYEYKRWTKKRYGYYEKPSELKRKRRKMAKLCSGKRRLHLFIGLKELLSRNGPNNSAGR